MLASVRSAAVLGVDALPVTVEVHVSTGLPQWTLVGLAATAVKESRDRISAALATSDLVLPPRRITVSLSPGDVPKTGTAFDLPIALALLAATGQVPEASLGRVCAVGELGLDGTLHAVRGVLTVARHAAATDALLVVPPANHAEAARVGGVPVVAPRTLAALVERLRAGPLRADPAPSAPITVSTQHEPDLADVVGQTYAQRALEIAAAGAHNLLLTGPPGAGKTMLARRLPGILPPLGEEEALTVLAVHSVAGLLDPARALSPVRPFRAPHHTVSAAGLVGGGSVPRPGEVSLAHGGVLFLDELSLFPRHALESLRQPLEDGVVTVARAATSVRFPARFMLVAATNPCPCGYAGDPDHACRCGAAELERHRTRLSGPLADRIDLHVPVRRVPTRALSETASGVRGESSGVVAARVAAARARQASRYAQTSDRARTAARTNGSVPSRWLTHLVALDREARGLLLTAADRLRLSARAYHRVLRVARTIADLDAAAEVASLHIAEALRYRGDDTPSGASDTAAQA